MTSWTMKPERGSPVPLYHQIAEALRYRIATGGIAAGVALPPLRDAARLWGVNLHTVRRAYAELAAAGVVETRPPVGTLVLGGDEPRPGDRSARESGKRKSAGAARGAFVERVIEEARARHGLSPSQLVAAIERCRGWSGPALDASVYVAECSATQAADLARQIEARFQVRAVPWPIDRPEPAPGRSVVSTYFHYNDLRRAWPRRFPDVLFLTIAPDPALPRRLAHAFARGGSGARRTVLVCEREASMLANIEADLTRLFPKPRYVLAMKLLRRGAVTAADLASRHPVLVSPRVYGELSEELRALPQVHELRYVFDANELERAGRERGWTPRGDVP